MSSIGPSLPPHLLAKRKRQDDSPSTSDTQRKPAAPPSPTTDKRRRTAGPSLPNLPSPSSRTSAPPSSPRKPTRTIGPAPPPAALSDRPSSPPSDSDSDSDFGPSLPSATQAQSATHTTPPPATSATHSQDASKPQREGWMTDLPPDSLRSLDPARQRARGFNTGRAAAATPSGGVGAAWTETPEEKRTRLANAVLGIGSAGPAGPVAGPKAGAKDSAEKVREQEATRRRIREHDAKVRGGESLMAQVAAAKGDKGEKEDDPSKRGFDWEKDMNTVGKYTGQAKKEMLNKAADFGGRFSGGGFL
ncbi:hypothetical protein BT63DRAFT_12399 [Microthyrium microscopicum]|uniref:DUF3752 domain-containing protein n=1 Tax=Microthyrium microscopicum TaxID=703497 RepID=A0A6A6UTX7_9PEZI|nr:hypothetical protein BT63DRAFT_12399 [Microthyrium microscopicum]